VFPQADCVAGPWLSPLPPWPWVLPDPAFEVFRCRPGRPIARIGSPGLLGLPLPFKAASDHPDRLAPASSRGIRLSPLHRLALARSLPARIAARLRPLAASRPIPRGTGSGVSFRPRGFAPPRRFPPLRKVRACCIPLPTLGFVAFPGYRDPRTCRSSSERALPFPATPFIPFEECPSLVAAPRHRGRCPLAVTTLHAAPTCRNRPEPRFPPTRGALAAETTSTPAPAP